MTKRRFRKQILALSLVAAIAAVPAAAAYTVSAPAADALVASPIRVKADAGLTFDGTDKSLFHGPNGSVIRVTEANEPRNALFYGTVKWFENTNNRLTLNGVNEEGKTEAKVLLTITDETRILNAVTGDPLAAKDIREGEMAYVYTSPVMTMSMPPQAGAELILVGIPADFSVPSYMEVDRVQKNDDGTVVLGTNQAINVTLTGETKVFPFLTRNIVTKEMIQPGQKVLVWHGPVLLSYPGQTTATKVMVFGSEYKGFVSLDGDQFSVNGEPMTFMAPAVPKVDGSTYLLPLRKVAEQLGYNVNWDAKTRTVSVSLNGEEAYRFVLGGDTWQAGDADFHLTRPITAVDGVSYVALDDLLRLHDLKMETRF